MKRWIFLTILALGIFAASTAFAWINSIALLAKAEPDECFAGIGEPYPEPESSYPFTCPQGSREKINQGYVWSLTRAGDSLWFGTGANILCTTEGAFLSNYRSLETNDYVCEFGDSRMVEEFPNIPDKMGDWRPAKIYEYDLETRTLHDRTPPALLGAIGIRSAGSHDGIVFMAGESLLGGVVMFAFDAGTKEYLGSNTFPDYRAVRNWLAVNGVLYTGMGTHTPTIGHVLRWFGNRENLWDFRTVGAVFGLPRDMTEYTGEDGKTRLVVNASSVWVSPPFITFESGEQAIGLLPIQASQWKEVWNPSFYEPDIVTRKTYVGGGIRSFDGWVYFGTMHIPYNAMDNHQLCTDPECFGFPRFSFQTLTLYYGTWRATSIWRARYLESETPEIQLLYGEASLPRYNPSRRRFETVANVGGYQPLYGKSGFGNRYNNYAWTMEVADGNLFVGTMDSSHLLSRWEWYRYGADLWRFDSSSVAAVSENLRGLGNRLNYGIRCLVASSDGTKLYAGMANPMNLASSGGWELLQLAK